MDRKYLTSHRYLGAAQGVLEKALCKGSGKAAPLPADPATAAAQASAAAAAAGGIQAGGADGREAGGPAAAAEGSIVPALQLMLELAVLLCFNEMFREGRLAAALVMLKCSEHGGEELLPFYTASGPLLMQVLWLIAEHEHAAKDLSSSRWQQVLQLFLAGLGAGMAVVFHSRYGRWIL